MYLLIILEHVMPNIVSTVIIAPTGKNGTVTNASRGSLGKESHSPILGGGAVDRTINGDARLDKFNSTLFSTRSCFIANN